MDLSRRKILITFTALGLSASMLMGFSYFGGALYMSVYKFISSQEAGIFRWLSWLFESPWTDMLMQYACMMGIAHIPAFLLICWLPKYKKPLMKLSGEDFIVCGVASLGAGYALNFLGTFINFWLSSFSGKDLMEMNPVTEMTMNITPAMFLYMCVVGPFMEELMFRGMLLKRARVFGDRTAVVFTAVLFGLLHGNVSQCLYATAIGLILGYVAVKTNSIRYTVAIHMVVNSFSVVMTLGESLVYEAGGEILSALYLIGLLGTIVFFIVGAVIVLARYGRHWYCQLAYHNGPVSDNRIFVYLNPGFALYVLICAVEFVYYLFG